MPKVFFLSIMLLVLALFSPLMFLPRTETELPEPVPTESPWVLPQLGQADGEIYFSVLDGDEIRTVTMAEHITGAVAAEMPALFETEALKAQAVAIRSYILRSCMGDDPAHPEADVCTDPNCCKGWLSMDELGAKWGEDREENLRRIAEAVAATDGQYLSYEGEVIQAVFHASSAGETEDSGGVWSPVPYLVSVDSPERADNVENLITVVSFTPEELKERISAARPQAVISDQPRDWMGDISLTPGGRVGTITLCGEVFTGTELRRALGLRSTDVDAVFDGEKFVFTVSGYGHGVGMSQHGAHLLAKDGMDYREILAHYYPGTELVVP